MDVSLLEKEFAPSGEKANSFPVEVNNFEQMVDFQTREDKTLDLILTSHPSYKQICKPMPSIGNSDHDIVLYDTSIKASRPKPVRRQISLWKQADSSEIKKDLTNFSESFTDIVLSNMEAIWKDLTNFSESFTDIVLSNMEAIWKDLTNFSESFTDIVLSNMEAIWKDLTNFSESFTDIVLSNMEAIWTDFKSFIQEIIEKRVPTKMTSARHSHPWMNGSIKRAIRQKQRAYRKSKRTQSKRDRDRYRRLQQQVQWESRRAHKQFIQDIARASQASQNGFGPTSKVKAKSQWTWPPSFLQSDNQCETENLNQQFSSVSTREDDIKVTTLILQCLTV